nr:uncharacterized protein LOC112023299 isoform X2 [Quercus suber]POF11267.1 hypothetical protein CFP56_63448 [Quercus suber]
MDSSNTNPSNLSSEGNEQEFRSYIAWLAAFSFLLGFLLTLLGWKYQNPGVSVFDTHRAIISLLILNTGRCCRQTLETMWHSTSKAFYSLCEWFPQSFQSVWRAHSQASTGPSIPTPNMKEKHVFGLANDV